MHCMSDDYPVEELHDEWTAKAQRAKKYGQGIDKYIRYLYNAKRKVPVYMDACSEREQKGRMTMNNSDMYPETEWLMDDDMGREQNLPGLISRADRLLHRWEGVEFGQSAAGIDPRKGQGRILALLQRTGQITQRDLCFLLDMRQQSLSELLKKL